MNRRGFLGTLGSALAGFTILPGAGRIWKATREPVSFFDEGPYRCLMARPIPVHTLYSENWFIACDPGCIVLIENFSD